MPTADQIARRLELAAVHRAAQFYLDISSDSADHLRDFIHSGVAKLVAEGGLRVERGPTTTVDTGVFCR